MGLISVPISLIDSANPATFSSDGVLKRTLTLMASIGTSTTFTPVTARLLAIVAQTGGHENNFMTPDLEVT